MSESKTARNARLKAMRRKYGLGEFKNNRSSSRAKKRRGRSVSVAKRRKGRSRASFGGSSGTMKDVLFSAGYGFVRQDVLGFVAPVVAMVPAGDYADNVALAGSAWLASRFISNPLIKQAAKTIVLNEAFLAGAKARRGGSFGLTTSAAGANSAVNGWT